MKSILKSTRLILFGLIMGGWTQPWKPLKEKKTVLFTHYLNIEALAFTGNLALPREPHFAYEFRWQKKWGLYAEYEPFKLGEEFRHLIQAGGRFYFPTTEAPLYYMTTPLVYGLINPPGDPDLGLTLPVRLGMQARLWHISLNFEADFFQHSFSFFSGNSIKSPPGLGLVIFLGAAF